MRCKCCNAIIETVYRKKKLLDPEDVKKNIEEDEDLCSTCLNVAQDCYLGYNEDAHEVRDEDVRRHFYSNEHSFDELYTIETTILEEGSIKIEEM